MLGGSERSSRNRGPLLTRRHGYSRPAGNGTVCCALTIRPHKAERRGAPTIGRYHRSSRCVRCAAGPDDRNTDSSRRASRPDTSAERALPWPRTCRSRSEAGSAWTREDMPEARQAAARPIVEACRRSVLVRPAASPLPLLPPAAQAPAVALAAMARMRCRRPSRTRPAARARNREHEALTLDTASAAMLPRDPACAWCAWYVLP